jgi:hypothetical protein
MALTTSPSVYGIWNRPSWRREEEKRRNELESWFTSAHRTWGKDFRVGWPIFPMLRRSFRLSEVYAVWNLPASTRSLGFAFHIAHFADSNISYPRTFCLMLSASAFHFSNPYSLSCRLSEQVSLAAPQCSLSWVQLCGIARNQILILNCKFSRRTHQSESGR